MVCTLFQAMPPLYLASILLVLFSGCALPSVVCAADELVYVAPPSGGGVDADGRGDAAHPFATLKYAVAITATRPLSTVVLMAGTHVLVGSVQMSFALHIDAAVGATMACADGDASAGIDVSGDASVVVVLTNITLSGCSGSALRVGGLANVTAVGALFADNEGENGGAARVSNSSHFECIGCMFTGNRATGAGGAVCASGASTVLLRDSVLAWNRALFDGGALSFADRVHATVSGTTIGNNTAKSGGALCIRELSVATLTNCNLSMNTAEAGGSVFIAGGSAVVTGGRCTSNTATYKGGCTLLSASGLASFQDMEIAKNHAGDAGGGIHAVASKSLTVARVTAYANVARNSTGGFLHAMDAGRVTVVGSTVLNCGASMLGGAFYIGGTATDFILSDSECMYNQCYFTGGAMQAERGSRTLVQRTLLHDNFAAASGGGIYASASAYVRVVDSTCQRNVANYYYAGFLAVDAAAVSLENSRITDNVGFLAGAVAALTTARINITGCVVAGSWYTPAVYLVEDAIVHATDVVFANNTTPYSGAALQVTERSFLHASGCTFTGNVAGERKGMGGAVQVTDAATAVIHDALFSSNIATRGGGAVHVNLQGRLELSRCVVTNNSVVDEDGGACGGGIMFDPTDTPNRNASLSVHDTRFAGNVAVSGGDIYTTSVHRAPLFGREIVNCTFNTSGVRVSSPPAFLSLSSAVPDTRVTSGGFLPSVSLTAVDAYGQQIVTDPYNVLVLRLLAAPSSAPNASMCITCDARVKLQGSTSKAVVHSTARFSGVRLYAEPGVYNITVTSGSPLFSGADFVASFPATVTPCGSGLYLSTEVIDGEAYPVCKEPTPTSHGGISAAVYGSVIPSVVVIASLCVGYVFWRKKRAMEKEARKYEVDFDELTLLSQIGQGSFGKVYLGVFRGSHVAIKTLCIKGVEVATVDRVAHGTDGPHSIIGSSFVFQPIYEGTDGRSAPNQSPIPSSVFKSAGANFMKEVRTMSTLRHPNIVMLLAASVQYPDLAIVVELMSRGSLYDVYRHPHVTMDWALRVAMARDAAQGLAYLHGSNPPIHHLDLKSPNLFVDEVMRVKVGDFGLAEFKRSHQMAVRRKGSILWMAPEVIRGEAYEGDRADVYSYGIVLWELLCRCLPYTTSAYRRTEIAQLISQHDVRPEIPPESPQPWVALMSRAWSRDPRARPSFPDVISALSRFDTASWTGDPSEQLRSRSSRQAGAGHNITVRELPYTPTESMCAPSEDGAEAGPSHA